MGQDYPPTGRYCSGADIEGWVDRQAPLVAVVNGAIRAVDLGDPWHRLGPAFVRRTLDKPAHLRLGATWKKPHRAGIRVEAYGAFNRLFVWNHEWRSITLDSAETDAITLAEDLWRAMLLVQVVSEDDLPFLKDAEGNLRRWCRLGCDLHLGLHGRLYCSCRI